MYSLITMYTFVYLTHSHNVLTNHNVHHGFFNTSTPMAWIVMTGYRVCNLTSDIALDIDIAGHKLFRLRSNQEMEILLPAIHVSYSAVV